MRLLHLLRSAIVLAAVSLLAGCELVVLNPAGDIAAQQGRLIIVATVLMLLIVVPVIFLILLFAWRYRQNSKHAEAEYDPEWHHSTKLELVIWSAPLLIVIALGALTWITTHQLDPYRPLDRISADKPLSPDLKPLEVEVVSLDWKWLFVLPEHGIATVNELAAPLDRPIRFKLTCAASKSAASTCGPWRTTAKASSQAAGPADAATRGRRHGSKDSAQRRHFGTPNAWQFSQCVKQYLALAADN